MDGRLYQRKRRQTGEPVKGTGGDRAGRVNVTFFGVSLGMERRWDIARVEVIYMQSPEERGKAGCGGEGKCRLPNLAVSRTTYRDEEKQRLFFYNWEEKSCSTSMLPMKIPSATRTSKIETLVKI